MKSPDEIKKGLRCLSHDRTHTLPCSDCEYHGQGLPPCRTAVHEDAIALIQQLQAEKAEHAERIRRLEAERDAYFAEIHGRCRFCVNSDGVTDDCDNICERCESDCPCKDCDGGNKWQWRGVQREE